MIVGYFVFRNFILGGYSICHDIGFIGYFDEFSVAVSVLGRVSRMFVIELDIFGSLRKIATIRFPYSDSDFGCAVV